MSRGGRALRAGQKGSGTVLVAGALTLAMVVAGAVLVVSGYVVAVHHARAAADLAALSGASAHGRGQDACGAAGRVATANRVRLAACRVRGDSFDVVVSVTVERRVAGPSAVLPGKVGATAHAGRLGLLQ